MPRQYNFKTGAWSLERPSDSASHAVERALAAPHMDRLETALAWAMNTTRTSLKLLMSEDITPQEWVDLVWTIAAWSIHRHPCETLHFRLYMHLRFVMNFEPADALELLSDVRTDSDTNFDPLRAVTVTA